MTVIGEAAWVAGGYLAGTFPATLVVSRARGARDVAARARRDAGETDPHILMNERLGARWTAVAGTADVLKAFLVVLAAREAGGLGAAWLALVGLAAVLGHAYPFYATHMAGRGLAAAAGVLLVTLPVEMSVAGALIVVGGAVRATGLATTVGMAGVPAIAAARGQPGPFVAMAAGVLVVLVARRLEGVRAVIRGGVSPGRALLWRAVFDATPASGSER